MRDHKSVLFVLILFVVASALLAASELDGLLFTFIGAVLGVEFVHYLIRDEVKGREQ